VTLRSSELIEARLLIGEILDELHIDAYLFEIEPREGHWELKVECAIDEGWGSYRVVLEEALLQQGGKDAATHERLQQQCRQSLNECRKGAGEKG
jgi:hypothetical protein